MAQPPPPVSCCRCTLAWVTDSGRCSGGGAALVRNLAGVLFWKSRTLTTRGLKGVPLLAPSAAWREGGGSGGRSQVKLKGKSGGQASRGHTHLSVTVDLGALGGAELDVVGQRQRLGGVGRHRLRTKQR